MADFDVLEKAKRAREAAAAKAAEVAGHASAKTIDLRDTVVSRAHDVRDTVLTAGADLRGASGAKVREMLADFNAAVPVLRAMGFALTDVEITLGLPPSLKATFQVPHEVTDEAVSRALEQNADRKLITFLIRALSQARRLQTSIDVVGMKPRGLTVEVGLTPGVSIKFA